MQAETSQAEGRGILLRLKNNVAKVDSSFVCVL